MTLVLSKPMEITFKETQVAVLEEDPHDQQSDHHRSCCEEDGGRDLQLFSVTGNGGKCPSFLIVIAFDNDVWLLFKEALFFTLDNQKFVNFWSREMQAECKQGDFIFTIQLAPKVIFR